VCGALCRNCPLRERCTTAVKGRTLVIGEHHALQRAARERATDPDWQEEYRRPLPRTGQVPGWAVAYAVCVGEGVGKKGSEGSAGHGRP
jgi:hypothetical protein